MLSGGQQDFALQRLPPSELFSQWSPHRKTPIVRIPFHAVSPAPSGIAYRPIKCSYHKQLNAK
jgi:hypothetical protein